MSNMHLFNKPELLDNFDGDEPFAQSILDEAIAEIPKSFELLRSACLDGNLSEISLQAHTMKGMAANLCASALRESACKIEAAARQGDQESARTLLAELEQTARKTVEAIRSDCRE